ncbi:hypothetical protein NM688_g5433 [Phlebia brevispora]|uniref:Uncharacterized protein n=1 Tax=Phlebia brevispora TaxID=194682 RepID=A0ACC1SV98_9APHY|nr:hypothetical protein NM688_g5433 [Phlebia brevispora]
MRASVSFIASALLPAAFAATYQLTDHHVGSDFLSSFIHEAISDPTHGRVNYVDQGTAVAQNLTFASGNSLIMRADDWTVLDPNGPGRNSVRIRSVKTYNTHVSVFDIRHMPQGCGTWPAAWETDESNWPAGGEVDIHHRVEGVNDQSANSMTLHTSPGCTMPASRAMTGAAGNNDCEGNNGCGVQARTANSYGPSFNAIGGGFYAMERTSIFIKIWFFPRNSNVPSDLQSGASSVDTDNWGTPTAFFPNDDCNIGSFFDQNSIIINLTFCGDWAGAVYASSGCPSTCDDHVNSDPGAFSDAYWDIAAVTIPKSFHRVSRVAQDIHGAPIPPVMEDMLILHQFERPVNIPIELYDGILDCFNYCVCGPLHDLSINLPGHKCRWAEGRRNSTGHGRHDMGQIALVCKRWATVIQPRLFKEIELHGKERTSTLVSLLKQPTSRISHYVQNIQGDLDGEEQLRDPWIHHIRLSLLPQLPMVELDKVRLTLEIKESKKMLSSIFPCPRYRPQFSSGVCKLKLMDVHFRSLEHLVRLLKEMPSVEKVECERVTWDILSLRTGQLPAPTSYMARDDPTKVVHYSMKECTDDAAASWLAIVLGQTRQLVLDRLDARALCTIASAWDKNSRESCRTQDAIIIGPSSEPAVSVLLRPSGSGRDQRRQVRSIVFCLGSNDPRSDWSEIDSAIETFPALEEVFICLSPPQSLDSFHDSVLQNSMPLLKNSPKLQFVVRTKDAGHVHQGDGLFVSQICKIQPRRRVIDGVNVTEIIHHYHTEEANGAISTSVFSYRGISPVTRTLRNPRERRARLPQQVQRDLDAYVGHSVMNRASDGVIDGVRDLQTSHTGIVFIEFDSGLLADRAGT